MSGHVPVAEKPPILLREDSHALEQLSSIITANDYEGLSNHATKAMGETSLFSIVQVDVSVFLLFLFKLSHYILTLCCFQAMLIMKRLMGCFLSHETALDHVRAKA